jgi:hypothetical protein
VSELQLDDAFAELRDRWRHRWPEALALWSRYTRLSEPRLCRTREEAAEEGLSGSFAMIRLIDSAVIVCLELVRAYKIEDLVLEVLGHEVGHHVLCPADLTDQGRLVARMRWGLPGKEHLAPFVANIYADLLINDRLRRSRELRMDEVFRRIGGGSQDRMWTFYMRIHELLWELERGDLALGKVDSPLDADARLGARLLRAYAGRWLDGSGRFAALCFPYLAEDDGEEIRRLLAAWRDAEGTGGAVPAGLSDIEPGEREGAFHPAFDPELSGLPLEEGEDAALPENVGDVRAGLRGQARQPFEYGQILRSLGLLLTDHQVAVRYYREQASRHLVPFPRMPVPRASDPLPEGVEPWTLGSPLEDLDYVETATRSPVVIPGTTTLQRVWGESEGSLPATEALDLDLYVDSSGSMPNPQLVASWLTLAGAVVALSALRAGGSVQATLWSGARQFRSTAGFVRDETEVLRILTGYLGGGTAFPIHVLRDTYEARRPTDRSVHIFVISDDGVTTMFDTDKRGDDGYDVAGRSLERARGGGTMALNLPGMWDSPELERAAEQGWSVVRVGNHEELLDFCRQFSHRTFGTAR